MMPFPIRLRAACALGLVLAWAAAAQVPPAPAPEQSAPPTPQGIAAARQEVAKELAEATRRLESAEPTAAGTKPESLVKEVGLLERIDLLLNQQLSALAQGEEIAALIAEHEAQLSALRSSGLPEPPPYSYIALEALRNELLAEQQRGPRIEAGVNATRDGLEQARRDYEEKERARRLAREAADGNSDEAQAQALAARLRLARLESRAADALRRLRQAELAVEQLNRDAYRVDVSLAVERIELTEEHVAFSTADLNRILVDLAATEQALRDRLDSGERNARFLEGQLFEAKTRLDAATDATRAVRQEEVAARRMAHYVVRQQVITAGKRIERLSAVKTAWERRFAAANGQVDRAELTDWQDDAKRNLAQLEIARQLLSADLSGLRNELIAVQVRIDAEASPDLLRWLREEKAQLENLESIYEASTDGIESARRVHQRLLDDLSREETRLSLKDRISGAWAAVKRVWQYELTSIDDRPITAGKVCIGLLALLLGIAVSRLLSTILGKRLLLRMGMPEGASAAIQSLAFYALLFLFALLALRIANVPLTVFTILGGAIAIGAGFGSQTIIKNFLSGLILLAERPIRVGDLIQVGDLYGSIEHVGPRSTRVRTGENIEIIVPNSSFLDENVVNWTLSETKVRVHVAVGVIYGSPTREVTRLLTKAVTEHGRVLKSRAPTVLFTEFGDNSLNFEVHFWIQMRNMMDRRVVESDIRFRIDSLFREAGIVIAFPQRDVHLDSSRPIDVRVLADASPAAGAAPPGRAPRDGTDAGAAAADPQR